MFRFVTFFYQIRFSKKSWMNYSDYNKIVKIWSDRLFRFLMKNLNDLSTAQDITQDSFEKLWINHKKVDFEKAKSFLFKTAYHLIIDNSRKDSSRIRYNTEKQHTHQTSSINESFDIKEIMQNAINLLPEKQRIVLTLRDLEGYSYKEIGEITLLSESQVKVYIYRARLFLKNYLVKLNIFVYEN